MQDIQAKLFEKMLLIRRCEEAFLSLFEQGKLRGTTHTSLGQEACSVGILSVIDQEIDVVFSNHRCHGHFLAYGAPLEILFGEMMGKEIGACKGIGGRQHLHYRNFYTNGIQGGIVPAAVGMAFAEKYKKSGSVVVVFLGDGTLGEGAVYESFNIASLWKLPVFFIVEANGYAQSTPTKYQLAGRIIDRPTAFGIPTQELKVRNPVDVHTLAKEIIDRIRKESEPECLILHTYRLGPHSKGDDLRFREEIENAKVNDPLNCMIQSYPHDDLLKLESQIHNQIETAIQACLNSGELSQEEFLDIVESR